MTFFPETELQEFKTEFQRYIARVNYGRVRIFLVVGIFIHVLFVGSALLLYDSASRQSSPSMHYVHTLHKAALVFLGLFFFIMVVERGLPAMNNYLFHRIITVLSAVYICVKVLLITRGSFAAKESLTVYFMGLFILLAVFILRDGTALSIAELNII